MISVDAGARAIRTATAWVEPDHLTVARVFGAGAFAAVDRLVTGELHLHDSQARPALILRDDGTVHADVVVGRIEGDFLLLVDGIPFPELADLLREVAPQGAALDVRDVLGERALLSIHGAFAWELTASWLGRFVIGLPLLTVSTTRSTWLLRSGRSGEFGYEALVPRSTLEAERARLLELGAPLDLRRVPQGSLDRCTLEAGGFVARRPSLASLSPVELQLQWRTSGAKQHRGRAGLDARRRRVTERITWFRAAAPVAEGAQVTLAGEVVGKILTCEALSIGDGSGGIALLQRRVAHPGLELRAEKGTIATCSAPIVDATSPRVRVHADSYLTRDRARFPAALEAP